MNPDPVDPASREADQALHWMRRSQSADWVFDAVGHRVKRQRRRRAWGLAATAAACSLAAGIVLFRHQVSRPLESGTAVVRTVQRETLTDGSTVDYGTGARVTVDFAGLQRRVRLDSGEAYFVVAADPRRPFVVEAGAAQVTALGTAFSVRRADTGVEVVVTEGRVAVTKAATVGTGVVASAGSRVVVEDDARDLGVEPIPKDEMIQRLAWRAPVLEFSRTPLEEVLALVNRHSGSLSAFVLVDPDLRTRRLSGVLRADNRNAFVRMLRMNLGIEASEREGRIELRQSTDRKN